MHASDRRKRVAEEAAEWWVVLQGEVSRAQREQYVDWLRETPMHVAEMLHIAQVHGALERFERWSRIPTEGSSDDDGSVVTLPTPQHRPDAQQKVLESAPRRSIRVWAVAATLLVVIGLTAALLVTEHGRIIQTERGERREVALADGSVVQVDPATRLRVKYEEHARYVFLERGRALFHVAKNVARPFFVEANDTTVRAVGTAFAVERQSDSIVVTVAEGKVAVFPAHSPTQVADTSPSAATAQVRIKASPEAALHPNSWSPSGHEQLRSIGQSLSPKEPGGHATEIFLTADQQIVVARSGSAEPVRSVDSGRALAWAEGRLNFDRTSVGDAIQQFNRYNRIQIIVNDADLARRPISGVFSAADPESFAAFLSTVARVHITHSEAADITIDAVH